ncbi:MAG TPA: inositol monophosphatase family protein [Candidatus Binataceae bacterium]|nr:inositol monophosphatase family protein [Candidatus Binataceae bacterium]
MASTLNDIEKTALRAARSAGRIHLARLQRVNVSRKTSAIDLVTEADHESEAAIIQILSRAYPTHTIVAEETGGIVKDGEHRWIIDPLDGTTNFAHGFPQFCTSIGYERRGQMTLGVVYDALKKECFTARRGKGAFLNGKRIRVSDTPSLDFSLLGTGFPYDRRQRRRYYFTFWEAFMMKVQGVRRTGSAALDLAYVACGRVDGFWEFGLKSWDVAAGSLIIEEAGGRVTNMDGSPLALDGGRILASNRLLHDQMVTTMAETEDEARRRQAEIE